MKIKRMLAIILALAAATSMVGCGGTNNQAEDGKVSISIGNWPSETNPESLEKQNAIKDEFMAAYPDITVIGDTYTYDTKTFTMKATAGQLPTAFKPWFTEIQQIIRQGFAADITDYMDKYGFTEGLNKQLIDLCTGEDGRIYGLPTDAYMQGLYVNKAIFKEAGLVNEDGSVKYPETWQDIADFSKIIREKTGKAGFILPTTNNCGGWMFLNIAWAFGLEDFCVMGDDGKWKAAFDVQATVDALEYVKDLQWEYNAFLDDKVINQDTMYKYFATSQGAMMIRNPPASFQKQYGLPNDVMACTKMPAGPAGRFSQMGGNLWMFSKAATPEQLDAAFEWIIHTGFSPEMSEEQVENLRKSNEQTIANGGAILEREPYEVWTNEDTLNKRRAAMKEYANLDLNDYINYFDFEDVTIKLEPAACGQQLYAILDGAIQEVMTNPDADCAALIKTAAEDYQVNHLDKM